jgi:phosphoribosylformylglycinamidine synthase subunit PurQ / glutaminase
MKFAVVVFPGSNCDHDAYHAIGAVLRRDVEFVWHGSEELAGADAVILPGGFAYGDYLRTGAIARFSPVMRAVARHARAGGLVLGICNGFQVLLEAGLLPGAMLPNSGLRFICRYVHIRLETTATPFTSAAQKGQVLRVPIAHGEGNYVCTAETLQQLEREDRIVFRYTTPAGEITPEANPNGSLASIAGIVSEGRNVMGMMPHPERAAEAALGSEDGLVVLRSMAESLVRSGAVA